NNGVTKYILRKAMESFLPPQVVTRDKRGFSIPLRDWLKGDFAGALHDAVLCSTAPVRGLFNPTFLNRMWTEQQSRGWDWSTQLWALLVFSYWYERFGAG